MSRQSTEQYENIMYNQKLAHKAWLNKAFPGGIPPSRDISNLVWELLVVFGTAVDDIDSAREYIYSTAYELATLVSQSLTLAMLFDTYRDRLVDSMLEFVGSSPAEYQLPILRFSNTISTAYAAAVADALKRSLRHSLAESLSQELRLAKNIQSHLLPKHIPVIDGYEFAGRLMPAEEVGGDYWSIKHQENDGIVTMKLADITGHGIAAATLVAAVKFISGGYYHGAASASEVVEKTNRVLTRDTPHEIMVSMAYAWLRPSTFELTIVNAGLEPVFLCDRNKCVERATSGMVMGLSEDTTYDETTCILHKNDIVFFGSDGITEAGATERFGLQRLQDLVVSVSDKSADEIADTVVETVSNYAPHVQDDISLLVVKVTGDPPETELD